MSKSRQVLARNKDFARRAERHHTLKEQIEIQKRELDKLGLKTQMYGRYGESRTIPVFQSPRGLLAQLIVARVPTTDTKLLKQVLGVEFKYPLVRKQVTYSLDQRVLRKLIRKQRLPKDIERKLTKERLTFDTYVPVPKRRRQE